MMLDQLVTRVSARVLALASVTVTLELDDGNTHERVVRPALPTNDKQLWIKLIHLDLERILHMPQSLPSSCVRNLVLPARSNSGSSPHSCQRPVGSTLPWHAYPPSWEQETSALQLCPIDIFLVVSAWHLSRFLCDPIISASAISRVSLRQLRPLEPVSVMLKNAKPESLRFRARRFVVNNLYGPWFASGAWWNRDRYRQEQWDLDARCEDGSLLSCCLMRDRVRNRWQMAALYD